MKLTCKLLLMCLIFLLFSCSDQTEKQKQAFLDKMPADTLLTFETYDASGQVVHPDVVWKDNSIYLALTPYPLFMSDYENPSLFESLDGKKYTIPKGIHNPLVEKPRIGFNCDPDMYVNEDGKLILFYLEILNDSMQSLQKLAFETDLSFKKSTVFSYNPKKGDDFILSPSFISEQGNLDFFYVKLSDKEKNTIKYKRIKDTESLTNQNFSTLPIKFPSDFTPWHVDVVKHNEYYYLFINGYYGKQAAWDSALPENYTVFVTKSKDLKKWITLGNVLNRKNVPVDDLKYLYRSSALITDKEIGIWYSFVNLKNEWKIGFKKVKN